MSHSYRHTPIVGITTAVSEKDDKQKANRRIRRVVREAIRRSPEAEALPHVREQSDPWTFEKDGKQWVDPRAYPKGMRK